MLMVACHPQNDRTHAYAILPAARRLPPYYKLVDPVRGLKNAKLRPHFCTWKLLYEVSKNKRRTDAALVARTKGLIEGKALQQYRKKKKACLLKGARYPCGRN